MSGRCSRMPFTKGIQILILLVNFNLLSCALDELNDFRFVSYEDLHLDAATQMFQRHDLQDFSQLAFDIPNQQIIVGARDYLLRLNMEKFNMVDIIPWWSTNNSTFACQAKGQPESECHNYIRVLLLHHDKVLTCGTHSHSPVCVWRKLTSLSPIKSLSGAAKCPFSPRQNNTYVMTSDGNYYSGTVTDFASRDSAISRTMGPSRFLRTVQYNSRWLNEPDFVSSYEIGSYIYFFYREVAIEYINCGKAIYSRVARICKDDSGGKVLLEDNWTTFMKARLNCSKPGKYPFYYNELQSTYYLEREQLVYAVFTTSPTSIYGSAVCVYNMSSFDVAFNGAFKFQESAQTAWTKVSESSFTPQCGRSVRTTNNNILNAQRHLVDVQKFQLMDAAVQPMHSIPPIMTDNERYTHIVTDVVEVFYHSVLSDVRIVFLATLEGIIKKYVILPHLGSSEATACLVEIIQVLPPDLPGPIKSMKLDPLRDNLIIGTNNRLYRIPKQRCHRYTTKIQCLNVQDPYCGWNEKQQKCLTSGVRNITSCPVNKYPVDGDWSDWTEWQVCSSPFSTEKEGMDQCLCRSRSCNNPEPANGGASCEGRSIQVINCTTPGVKPVERWSDWSDWTDCSVDCGDGHQTRMRICIDQAETKQINDVIRENNCKGANREMRVCNLKKCEGFSSLWSNWTRWYRTNTTKYGHNEERLRCNCKMASSPGQVYSAEMQTDFRTCPLVSDEHNCRPGNKSRIYNTPLNTLKNKSTVTKCHKKLIESNRENSIIKKRLEEMISDTPRPQAKSAIAPGAKPSAVELVSKSSVTGLGSRPSAIEPGPQSYPLGNGVFSGYCGCRDLGLFRVCHKCQSSATRNRER